MPDALAYQAAFNQVNHIGKAQPGGQVTAVDRLRETGIDAQTGRFDAKFVEIHFRQIFDKTLGNAIKRVRVMRGIRIGADFATLVTDGVDRTSVNNTFDAMATGGFVHVIAAFNGALQDLGPGPFNRGRTEVNYRITAFNDLHYRVKVAEFTGHGFFMRLDCADVSSVGKAYRSRQRRQASTQLLAEIPRGTGN